MFSTVPGFNNPNDPCHSANLSYACCTGVGTNDDGLGTHADHFSSVIFVRTALLSFFSTFFLLGGGVGIVDDGTKGVVKLRAWLQGIPPGLSQSARPCRKL